MSILDNRTALQGFKNQFGLHTKHTAATSEYIAERQWISRVAEYMDFLSERLEAYCEEKEITLPGNYKPGDRIQTRVILQSLSPGRLDKMREKWDDNPDFTITAIIKKACADYSLWHSR